MFKRKWIGITVGSTLLALTALLGVLKGSVSIDFSALTDTDKNILFYVRIPRVFLAALVGAALSLSGALFQYVMKNPLADSFTTGVSASAAMGAVVAIMTGLTGLVPLFAFVAGVTGLFAVYRISTVAGRVQPITMLLAGIVVSTFSSATISFMKYLSDDAVSSIVFWLMGGFQAATFGKDLTLLSALLIVWILVRREYMALDIICFDDRTARASGVDVDRLRKISFFVAALLTAFSVGYAGIIAFVGLIVPHVLRLAGIRKAEELIPMSMVTGAVFMILNDLVSRTMLPDGQELPVGIITSSLGEVSSSISL